jgi:hypothetical protein
MIITMEKASLARPKQRPLEAVPSLKNSFNRRSIKESQGQKSKIIQENSQAFRQKLNSSGFSGSKDAQNTALIGLHPHHG